jgi:hypothetical protein
LEAKYLVIKQTLVYAQQIYNGMVIHVLQILFALVVKFLILKLLHVFVQQAYNGMDILALKAQ